MQPIYIRLFFEKAFNHIGGEFTEIRKSIFRIDKLPDVLAQTLRHDYNIFADTIRQIQFCFDKQVFLEYLNIGDLGKVHYINPSNPVFDSLVKVIRSLYREDMLKGTVLISPIDKEDYFAFFVKSQITDNRPHKDTDSVADERLMLVQKSNNSDFQITSPAKFIDLHPPAMFTKPIEPPEVINQEAVVEWSFNAITLNQFEETKKRVSEDTERRKDYLETAFTHVIMDMQIEIQELQGKVLIGDMKAQEKILKKQERINELIAKKNSRLDNLDLMTQLAPKAPEVLGCAYVVPLSQVEYQNEYGMSRDDEVEAIAMDVAMKYEIEDGWRPEDVSKNNEGYDIRSTSADEFKRYIEVKGRSAEGGVMLSENEMNRLAQLGDAAWLYMVMDCKTTPQLYRIQNPANTLKFELKSKGVQYFLTMEEWKQKIN